MPLAMPRPQMPLSLRYTSAVSLFGLLSSLNSCRHYLGTALLSVNRPVGADLRVRLPSGIGLLYNKPPCRGGNLPPAPRLPAPIGRTPRRGRRPRRPVSLGSALLPKRHPIGDERTRPNVAAGSNTAPSPRCSGSVGSAAAPRMCRSNGSVEN